MSSKGKRGRGRPRKEAPIVGVNDIPLVSSNDLGEGRSDIPEHVDPGTAKATGSEKDTHRTKKTSSHDDSGLGKATDSEKGRENNDRSMEKK